MGSSVPQSADSTGSQSSDIVDNSSMMVTSKRDIFLSTYRRQNFTFPNSIMHYIAKNPKNTKVYQKMIKRCKYFFIKNPILVLSHLRYVQNGWITLVNDTWKSVNINTISTKLWITYQLSVSPANVRNDSLASSIIRKIYQCNFKYLLVKSQIISFNEFMFLCSSVEDLTLERVTVKNDDDGTVVSFEKLINQLPKVKSITYTFSTPSNNTSKNICKEFWKNPHVSNYYYFSFRNIPEDFDIDCFYSFMKKNKNTFVRLFFSDELSEEYKTRLEAIVDEIIETKNHEYKPPLIDFPGLDRQKVRKLRNIF